MAEKKEKKLSKKELKKEHYEKMVEEELKNVKKYKIVSKIQETSLPPVIMRDKYGNDIPHYLVDDKYVHSDNDLVIFQERKIVMEYKKLEKLKFDEEVYKLSNKTANKGIKKNREKDKKSK